MKKKILLLIIFLSTIGTSFCMKRKRDGSLEKENQLIELYLNAKELYQTGKNYYYQYKEYEQAFQYFKMAAKKNHREAQFFVAQMSYFGLGCKKDLLQALKYCKIAKKRGNNKSIQLLQDIRDEILIYLLEEIKKPIKLILNSKDSEDDEDDDTKKDDNKIPDHLAHLYT